MVDMDFFFLLVHSELHICRFLVWLSYLSFPPHQVIERAENLGSAFLHKGHSKDGDPYIGIFSQNRPEVRANKYVIYCPNASLRLCLDFNLV